MKLVAPSLKVTSKSVSDESGKATLLPRLIDSSAASGEKSSWPSKTAVGLAGSEGRWKGSVSSNWVPAGERGGRNRSLTVTRIGLAKSGSGTVGSGSGSSSVAKKSSGSDSVVPPNRGNT